jgi:hypothetical protein
MYGNPLEHGYSKEDIDNIIIDNYVEELKEYCREAGFTVSLKSEDSQKPTVDSVQNDKETATTIIEFHNRGKQYKIQVRGKVVEGLKVLIIITISGGGKSELSKNYGEDDIQELVRQITGINSRSVSNGHYFLQKNIDKYTINFQTSYFVKEYEFDKEVFSYYLTSGLNVVKKHGLL